MTLDEIAIKYGTDKSTKAHGYTRVYEQFFEKRRNNRLTLLELGFGGHEDPSAGGASAQMWRDYFRKGEIVVVDNEKKILTDAHKGIKFRQGSQDDEDFLDSLHDEFAGFDIIIDDASHLSSLTIRSFELLWPKLVSGGIYVVEDTHMAYHDWYYGKEEANPDPDAPTSKGTPTAMQFLRRLADEANYRSDGELYPAEYNKGYEVASVHFYYNLCVVVKR